MRDMTDVDKSKYSPAFPRLPGFVRIGGAPIDLHWSSVSGGLIRSAAGAFRRELLIPLMVAYVLVVLVHEAGHARHRRAAAGFEGLRDPIDRRRKLLPDGSSQGSAWHPDSVLQRHDCSVAVIRGDATCPYAVARARRPGTGFIRRRVQLSAVQLSRRFMPPVLAALIGVAPACDGMDR